VTFELIHLVSSNQTCAKGSDQATIAACACSTQTLGDLRSCAAAISTSTKSSTNATQVVVSYNAFVDLCQTEGLATVTGTIAAGESTSAVSRASSTSSPSQTSTSASSRPTYNAQSTHTSTATVAQLATGSQAPQASGVSNSNAKSTNSAPRASAFGGSVLAIVGFAFYTLI
jgi:hypothetical protein